MSRRVVVRSKVKEFKLRSRRETKSEQGVKLRITDPKPDDLSVSRLKPR